MTSKAKKKPESRVPGWVWLFTGILLGALIVFLMRLSELQLAPTTTSGSPAPKVTKDGKEPRFEFYDLLRNAEVAVPAPREPADKPPAKADPNMEYLLQVASFRSLADAQQVRAELTLLNLKARVEEANVGKGETWHRVVVGPYSSRSDMSKARTTLMSNRYQPLLLTRKAAG